MSKTYVLLFEDGSVMQTHELGDGLLKSADDGIVDVLDVSDPEDVLRYLEEGWVSVEVAPKGEGE